MNGKSGMIVGITIVFIALVLFVQNQHIGSSTKNAFVKMDSRVKVLEDSLAKVILEVDSLKRQVPGLGEYMTDMQLHIAKLWYAASAENWGLAEYELNELTEGIEGAKAFHAIKNQIDISAVLQSIQQTLVSSIADAVKVRDIKQFKIAYAKTLTTCNDCHKSAGYPFIHLSEPSGPPVTNQSWKLVR